MANITLKRNFESSLTEPMWNETTWEIAVYLSSPPSSQMWFLLIDPWLVTQESIFHHRVVWNIAYVYWVNRDVAQLHLDNARVVLSNSIDYLNYCIGQSQEQTYTFKKSATDLIVKWWNFFISSNYVVIDDLDTSSWLPNKTLISWATNYIYIKDYDYFISTDILPTLYRIAVVTMSWPSIQNITKMNTYSVWTQWIQWETWDEWIQWPQWDQLILRNSWWQIQWKVDAEWSEWANLYTVAEITWADWAEIEMQVDQSGTWIQWKLITDIAWTNLITTQSLKGQQWNPWDIWNPWLNWQTIADIKPIWTSTKTFSDIDQTVTITESSWYYTLYWESSIKKYTDADEIYMEQEATWTYVDWWTISYTSIGWETLTDNLFVDETWWVTFTGKPAYLEWDTNEFKNANVFNKPVAFKSNVSFPYAEIILAWWDWLKFDAYFWSKQYKNITNWMSVTAWWVFHLDFYRLVPWETYSFVINNNSWWDITINAWTIYNSSTLSNIYSLGWTKINWWTTNNTIWVWTHLFVCEAFSTAVHISYWWESKLIVN